MQDNGWEIVNQPCPCGDGSDNTGINKDGSAHCFKCNQHFPNYEQACKNGGVKIYEAPEKSEALLDRVIKMGDYTPIPDRKISVETCKTFGVQTVSNGSGIINHIYPYHDEDGNIIGKKTRVVSNKDFFYEGTKGDLFFGQQLFKGGAKFLTVVEGELDALAAFQMLSTPKFNRPAVVSIKNGASSAAKAFKSNLSYLESFDHVVLCFDEDEAGQKAVKDVCKLLSPGKCKIMTLPKGFKDPCDMLKGNQSASFIQAFWNSEVYIPSGILNASKLKNEFFTEDTVESIPYPWEGLNDKLFGLRKKELLTLTGGTGLGKSSVTRELEHWLLNNTDDNVGIMALEEDWKRTLMGIVSIEANARLFIDNIRAEYPKENIKEQYSKLFEGDNADRLFVHAHLCIQNLDDIFAKLRYLIIGCDCQWIIFDHLHMLVASHNDGDERKAIDDIMLSNEELKWFLQKGYMFP